MFLLLLLIVAYIVYHVKLFVNVQRNRRYLWSVPAPPLDSIFGGHYNTVRKAQDGNTMLDLWMEWIGKYGSTVAFFLNNHSFILTTDPAILKELSTDVTSYRKSRHLPNRALFGQKLIGTKSILSGNGLHWATKRKLMAQFFAKKNMTDLFSACEPHMKGQEVRRWKDLVHKGSLIDLHEQLAITFTSYLQALGFQEFLSPEIIATNVEKILTIIPKAKEQGLNKFFLSKEFSSQKEAAIAIVKDMREELLRAATKRLESMCNSPNDPVPNMDLLGFLIRANVGQDHMGLEVVVDDVMTVCLVWDNMVKQLCALFIHLNDCPEAQEKMFAEIRGASVETLGELNNLRYTEMCLLEAMRMTPAVMRGIRQMDGSLNSIGPYDISKAKVSVHFSEYLMQNNPQYWENPRKFNPERWHVDFKPEPYSYMPFYTGVRGCIAKHMAMMMMKLTISTLVKNFEFKQKFDVDKPPVMSQTTAIVKFTNTVHCYVTPL